MTQLRQFYFSAGAALLTAVAMTVRAQQPVQQTVEQQSVQQSVQDSVQESEKQAVQQAVQQATQHAMQQSLIGTVAIEDAIVAGAASTVNGRAVLVWNGTVTAKDRVAYVELARGGSIRVCATSALHLTAGAPPEATSSGAKAGAVSSPSPTPTMNGVPVSSVSAAPPPPLMLSLDRGALEVRMNSVSSDVLMTPDLRIAMSEPGPLDARIRVTRNGDTCVENRVAGFTEHPTLRVGSLFGDDTYDVLPGQHVLFEGANLHEVVDNESSPCGCPEAPAIPVVEAGNLSLKAGEKVSSAQAEAQHPFPADVSQGLAVAPAAPPAPPGAPRAQVATTLSYSDPDSGVQPVAAATAAKTLAAPSILAPSSPPAKKGGFFRSIGHFFKKVF